MKERRSGRIRLVSSFSILGMFGGFALLKWLGSSSQEGEGMASLGSGIGVGLGGFLLGGVGLLLGVLLIRSVVRRALESSRAREMWLEGDGMDARQGERNQLQSDQAGQAQERTWQFDPVLWIDSPLGDGGGS